VFEGALSLWHIAIVLVVVFFVMGPRRIRRLFQSWGTTLSELGEGSRERSGERPAASPASVPHRKSLAYRVGRWRRGRRDRRARSRDMPPS
jgi:Sec-independent protein translocase protein TatA